MREGMTIGELAGRVGVAVSTLRFYEREGLLRPDGRSAGNYRIYRRDAAARARFIRAARESGLSVDDIRSLLDLRDGSSAPCGEVQAIVEGRLRIVGEQMARLRGVRRTLQELRAACETAAREDGCPAIEKLDG